MPRFNSSWLIFEEKCRLLKSLFIFSLFIYSVLAGCTPQPREKITDNLPVADRSIAKNTHQVSIEFAQHFSVGYGPGYKLVEVKDPWPQADQTFRYLLVEPGHSFPDIQADAVIEIPLKNIVCTSTSHIPLLTFIGESEKLIAFPSTNFITSPKIRDLIDQGKITDLGPLSGLNMESLLQINPDLVMGFGTGNQYRIFHSIANYNIPVVFNGDYMEETPLGRAEWLKFGAVFFNREKEADSVFNSIQRNYDSLINLVAQQTNRPTVFSGILYGDTWFMSGGQNYAAKLLEDAGADFIWKQNQETGWMELSFEVVYDKAHQADKWIGVGSYNSLEEINDGDHRYSLFSAYKNQEIYNYNARIGEKGGFEYFELGYARPDLILADLIKILYPHLLPDYQLYFYQKLD